MSLELFVAAVSIRAFRNLRSVDLELGPGFVVFSGDNGQGKTNLIEAVYAVATSKSFRVSKPGELVMHEEAVASVRATLVEGGDRREQSIGLKEGARLAKIDGQRPASLAAYAVRSPVVVFHPGELSLSMGGGSERRRLLDRIALYLGPKSAEDLDRYTRAQRERQRALEVRGPGARDLPEWEEIIVRHGLEVFTNRERASSLLAEEAKIAFAKMAPAGTAFEVRYAPGGPIDASLFRRALEESRVKDAHRGSASVGPHRDDLVLSLSGRSTRGVASQGQHRGVVLALKAAEVEVLSKARGTRPLLLLDDVSSELDRERTAALFRYLEGHTGQVFLTTTRPELIAISGSEGGKRQDFFVREGGVLPRSGPLG